MYSLIIQQENLYKGFSIKHIYKVIDYKSDMYTYKMVHITKDTRYVQKDRHRILQYGLRREDPLARGFKKNTKNLWILICQNSFYT